MDERSLTELFRKLGASDPELWASSQAQEGINQLTRFLFLRQAWQLVLDEDDADWIGQYIESSQSAPEAPFAGIGHALARLRAGGATDQDLTDVVRGMQVELLHGLCYLLEDPGDLEPEVEQISWSLYELDEDGEPAGEISGLHESVLNTDPTGREMRPRRTS